MDYLVFDNQIVYLLEHQHMPTDNLECKLLISEPGQPSSTSHHIIMAVKQSRIQLPP